MLLAELQEVIGLSCARSAMQAVSVEDPTLTISEIARCLSPDSMSQLKGETLRRTTERSDRITPNELKKIFRQIGLDLNDDAWPQVFQELDRDAQGRIRYTEFVDALERAEEECRQCGIAAAMAAGGALGQSALQAGLGLREAADCAAGAALRAAAEFGMVPVDAAALGGRAAAKLAAEQSLDRAQAADAAAEAAGQHATRAALEADLTLEQVADEAAIAASAAAEEAGSGAQQVAEVSARAAGVAAGELAAEAGNTAMKSAEIAAKAATKSAAASGLPPYQAVEPVATAAARSAMRAALNGGHPYLIVAEVTRQLNSQLVENLKEVHQNRPDRLSVSELKDLFGQANIDIHEDTLRQVFEEMGVEGSQPISFQSFFQALEKSHGIFMEAGKAAASIAGRVLGQSAASAGDDPEQAGEVAASAAQAAARTSGLSDEQLAEVAVTAAGNAAGHAALAAGGAPEAVAFVAGQAAINAATTAGLNTQRLPQVIIPVFARAAGRAAAQRAGNGRDSSKALEVAARAASDAGLKLAFMTDAHIQEAAETASNEASRVLASGPGPKPVPGGRGKGAGRGRASGTGRGAPSTRPKAPPSAPAPKPAAKKAAAKPKPEPKAPPPKAPAPARPAPAAPAAAPEAKPKAAPKAAPAKATAPRPKSRTGSLPSAGNSARSGSKQSESRPESRPESRGETPKAKPKAKSSTSSRFKGLSAEATAPDKAAPRTAEAEREATLPPSSRSMPLSQTQPALKAHSASSPAPEVRMVMEPIAQASFAAPSGKSLQVPAVQRFYTPYMVARPASATIPVAPGGTPMAVSPTASMSPPSVFRSPSQPVISPPRTSLGVVPAMPSGTLQRAATSATTPVAGAVLTAPQVFAANMVTRSVTGAPYTASTPGRYQPTAVLVSPQPTMRVLENPTALPFGTMTAPPAGAVPCGAPCASVASVQRLETNREVRPSVVPAPWTFAEPVTPGATLAAPVGPPRAMAFPPAMAMAYPSAYRPMTVPTVAHCQ